MKNNQQRFDKQAALASGAALTRDGRLAYVLSECIIDGEPAIIGLLSREKFAPDGKSDILSEQHYWSRAGLGTGEDDLVQALD